jgi:hypothetical protein
MSKLTIQIGGTITGLQSALSKGWTGIKNFASRIKGALGLSSLLSGAGIAAYANKIINELDNIAKSAKSLGASAEFFQKLDFAAQRSGSSVDAASKALKRMTRVVSDAGNELATSIRTLNQLGLTYEDLKGKSVEDQFKMVAAALNSVEDSSKKAALAQEIFGRAGADMINLVRDYERLAEEAEKAGFIISDQNVEAAEKFKDAMLNLGKAMSKTSVDSGFIQWLVEVAEGMAHIAKQGDVVKTVLKGMVEAVATGKFAGGGVLGKMVEWTPFGIAAKGMSMGFDKETAGAGPVSAGEVQAALQKEKSRAAEQAKMREVRAAAEKAKEEEEAQKALEKAAKLEQDQTARLGEHMRGLEEKLRLQKMILDGKEKEAAIEKELNDAAKRAGRDLSDAEKSRVAEAAAALYDATVKPEAAAKALASAESVSSDAVRRIGGNIGGSSAEMNIAKEQLNKVVKIEQTLARIDDKTAYNASDAGRWPA